MTVKEKIKLEDFAATIDYLSQCEDAIQDLTRNWAVGMLVSECVRLAEQKALLLAELGMKENDALGAYFDMKCQNAENA